MSNVTPSAVLDYKLGKKRVSHHAAFKKWRASQGVSNDRCDNEVCVFHTQPLIWNGKPLKPILDHIDGNKDNGRPDNLRFLCPNCDSQLPTRGGGNKGRIQDRAEHTYRVVGHGGQEDVTKVLVRSQTATFGSVEPDETLAADDAEAGGG